MRLHEIAHRLRYMFTKRTCPLEPVLQGLRDIKGQPLVFPFVMDKAGADVAGRVACAAVQLHSLLILYLCVLDKHPQLCAGQQAVIPHTFPYLGDVEEHRHCFGAVPRVIFFCLI